MQTNSDSLTTAPLPRVLVIDDEDALRRMLTYALISRGFDVSSAPNGEEGVLLAKKQKFDVVVSDLVMPKMGGLDVLMHVKEIDPKIEVIIATGYASIDTALSSMKKGAYDYITKPFEIDDLERLIQRALEKRRLNLKVNQLQELNRLKSEFLANMSHELRTPMNAIIGYTSLISDGIYGQISDEAHQALGRVSTNAKNLLELINNILDHSKLLAGRMPVFIENCRIRDVAQEVIDALNVLASEKKLSLTLDAPEDHYVSTDKTKLKQVLINLVGNGIKFTSQGGISIGIKKISEKSAVQISVKDTGFGIKAENLPELFQQFKQLDSSSTREQGGTGLGLSISKQMVDLLGGTIEVESVHGKGSTFTVTLPCESNNKNETSPPSSNGLDPRKNLLLAIDDDPDVLNLLKDSLHNSGFAFAGAQSGEEGLAMARQLRPSIITLDIMMPHLDGWSVLQLLKNDPELASIPVIIISIMENKALGFSLGIADYIVKPFDRFALLATLHSQISTPTRREVTNRA